MQINRLSGWSIRMRAACCAGWIGLLGLLVFVRLGHVSSLLKWVFDFWMVVFIAFLRIAVILGALK